MRDEDLQLPSPARRARRAGRSQRALRRRSTPRNGSARRARTRRGPRAASMAASATSPTRRRSSVTTPDSTSKGAFAGPRRHRQPPRRRRLLRRPVGHRPGPRQSPPGFGQAGREGIYSLNLGYAEIPRHLTEGARTPFLGSGGSVLTLPAGLSGRRHGQHAARQHAAADRHRLQLQTPRSRRHAASASEGWSANLSLRHDERDGTRPTSGSFFSTASQFARAGEREDRPGRAHGGLCDQADCRRR